MCATRSCRRCRSCCLSSRNFPRSRLAIVARVEALRRLLRGEFDQAVEFSRAPQLGGVFGLLFVLKQIAQALGIGAALGHRRLAKLALFLVLARVAPQGSRLSAIRWAQDQAVAEVLGLGKFEEGGSSWGTGGG